MQNHPCLCLVAALSTTVVLACGNGDPAGPESRPPVATELPPQFRIEATASTSTPDGSEVECSWLLFGELVGTPRGDETAFESEAWIGGEVRRSVLRDDAGQAFIADMFGTFTARLIYPDSIDFVDPDVDPAGSRFWEELTHLAGRLTTATDGGGSWSCFPLDITEGGWVDTAGVALGNWSLRQAFFGSE